MSKEARPHFGPSQVRVVSTETGAVVHARRDPSNDYLSPDDIPTVGLISMNVPVAGRYLVTINGPPRLFLIIALNPGAEVRLLVGWIVLFVVGLLIVVLGILSLVMRIVRRHRATCRALPTPPTTIDEWIARSPR